MVHPRGIEPLSQDPQSCVLSVELWVPIINYNNKNKQKKKGFLNLSF